MSNSMRRICASVFLWILSSSAGEAASGDWDRSYGVEGRMPLSIAGIGVRVMEWAPLADGRFVTAGRVLDAAGLDTPEFLLARFNADGTPDVSFEGDGYVRFDWSGQSGLIGSIDLALLADGRPVIAAQVAGGLRAMRLNVDGSRDATFGTNGEVTISDPARPIYNPRLVLLPNGSAIIAGMIGDWMSNPNIVLVKLTAAGAFDPSFGVDGRAQVDRAYGIDAYSIAALADGTLLLGGKMGELNDTVPIVARVTSTGQLDTTFGSNGITELSFLSGSGDVSDVTVGPDGSIVVVGHRADSQDLPHHFIARLNRDGGLDPTFGSAGRIIVGYSALGSVVVEPDGKVVVAGGSQLSGGDALLARFNVDGSPDVTFGLRGQSRTEFNIATNSLMAVLSDPHRSTDGSYRALVGGRYLARFLASGPSAGIISLSGPGAPFAGHDERGGRVPLYLYRSGGTDGVVSVQYRVVGETATAGQDFVASTGTITFNEGETVKVDPWPPLTVELLDDSVREPEETFYAELFAPTGGAGLANSRVNIRIMPDEDAPPLAGFVTTRVASVEGAGVARLLVHRYGNIGAPLSLNYATNADNATGSDFTPNSGTLSWAANEGGVRTIDVPLIDDTVDEHEETLSVYLSSATSGVTVSDDNAVIHIADDDDPNASPLFSFRTTTVAVAEGASMATLEVRRLGNPATAVSATWTTTPSSSSTAGQDFTAASGTLNWDAGDATPRTISVPILDDATPELAESFGVNLQSVPPASTQGYGGFATVAIVDDEPFPGYPVISISPDVSFSEGASNATLMVSLSTVPLHTVTVRYNQQFETATFGDVPGINAPSTLTWSPGDASPKVLTLLINNDSLDELDETFTLALTSVTGGATLGRSAARVTILDDDPTPAGQSGPRHPGVSLEPAAPIVSESERSFRMRVSRVGPSEEALYVGYSIVGQTASSQTDYVTHFAGVQWEAGETAPKEFDIQLNGDMQAEPNETFLLRFSPRQGGYGVLPVYDVLVTVVDDDQGGDAGALVELVNAAQSVNENATSVTLQVARSGNTSIASSIDFTTVAGTAGEGDFVGASGTLTWQANDTSMKLITVNLTPDAADEADETFTLQLRNVSALTQLGTASATVTIVDDDGAVSGGGSGGGGGGGGGQESLVALLLWAALLSLRRPLSLSRRASDVRG